MNRMLATGAFLLLAGAAGLGAGPSGLVVVTSSNAATNELLVHDAAGTLVQSVATGGVGGAGGNGGGIAVRGRTVAVVNFGSGTVSLLTRAAGGFELARVIPTVSAPLSVAFGKGHLYVLGTSTVESHRIERDGVAEAPDGVVTLLRADASAAQVGVVGDRLVVSEKSEGLQTVRLRGGAVTGTPVEVGLPAGSSTPFGLVTRGGNAYVTFAASDEMALVKHGVVVAVTATGTPGGAGQHAPCWAALTGPYLYSSNTPSRTLSRFVATRRDVILEQPVAAQMVGGPTDIAARGARLAVIDSDGATGRLTQFAVDAEGNLSPLAVSPIPATANGVGIVAR